jgi:hypothetical protein
MCKKDTFGGEKANASFPDGSFGEFPKVTKTEQAVRGVSWLLGDDQTKRLIEKIDPSQKRNADQ